MTVLNDADRLYFGALNVKAAWLGGLKQVWTLPVPVNTVAPAVTGGTTVGSTLTCSTGTWTNSPTSYAYQWQVDDGGWTDLTGETANTLDTTGFDPGDVRCVVTATNGVGDSVPTASNVVALSSGTPRVFGYDGATTGGAGLANNRLLASKFVKAYAGAITAVSCELSGQDGWYLARVRVVALADNAGVPGDVLWYTDYLTPANGSTVQTFTLPGDVSDTDAAGTYWLGVAFYETPGNMRVTTAAGIDMVRVEGFNVATPPSTCPAPDTTYGNQTLRVWCDYIG